MTLWGSQTLGPLAGITGDPTVPSTAWVPGLSPRRLASNALVDVQADAARTMPQIGGGQGNDRPIGPFLVTLTPITLATGAPLALAPAASQAWRKLVARVVFGRGGTKCEAWIDWPMQGGSFVVAADTLSVNAMALDPDTALPTEPQTWDVRCGAWATPMFTGRGSLAPRYTMRLPTPLAAGGGTSGEVLIPPFARRFQWSWNNLISQGTWVVNVLLRRYGVTFAQHQLLNSPNRNLLDIAAVPADLATEATTIVVNNASASLAVVDARLVFDLDVG